MFGASHHHVLGGVLWHTVSHRRSLRGQHGTVANSRYCRGQDHVFCYWSVSLPHCEQLLAHVHHARLAGRCTRHDQAPSSTCRPSALLSLAVQVSISTRRAPRPARRRSLRPSDSLLASYSWCAIVLSMTEFAVSGQLANTRPEVVMFAHIYAPQRPMSSCSMVHCHQLTQ